MLAILICSLILAVLAGTILTEIVHWIIDARDERRTEVPKYYSVLIPFSKRPTQWHPTESTGPFSTLVRGAFDTRTEAIVWAERNLEGQPYRIRENASIAAASGFTVNGGGR